MLMVNINTILLFNHILYTISEDGAVISRAIIAGMVAVCIKGLAIRIDYKSRHFPFVANRMYAMSLFTRPLFRSSV